MLVACALLCSAPLFAQNVSEDAADAEEAKADAAAVDLGTYSVVASKMPRPVQEVVGTVTVIDGERLDNELAQDIQQAIRYEPGISVSRDGARFGISGYNIRGVTGNRVQIEMDGIPIPEGFRVGSFSNAGRDLVDVELLSRMEILRGPASALYGSDAIGGVVAYSTWDPEDFLWRVDDDRYFGLRGGYFSVDDSWMGTVAGAGASDNWQGMVLFSVRDGGERENNGNIPPNPADFNTQNLLAKVVYDASGNPLRLTLQGQDSNRKTDVLSERGERDLSAFVGFPLVVNTTSLLADDTQHWTRVGLDQVFNVDWSLADSGVWRLYHLQSDVEQHTVEERTSTAFGMTTPLRRNRLFSYDQRLLGGEATLQKDIQTDSVLHQIVYGLELEAARIEEKRTGFEENLNDGSVTDNIGGEQLPTRDFPNSDIFQAGLYAQDEIVFPDEHWRLIGGLRLEYYDLDPDPDPIFEANNPADPVGTTDTSLSPKLGALYHLDDAQSFYGHYVHGFRVPPFNDVNFGLALLDLGFIALPNPDLKPETVNGFEFGYRYDTATSQAAVSFFYNDYDDFIESRVNQGVDPDTGFLVFQSVNRTEAVIYGAEFRGEWDISRLLPGEGNWKVRGILALAKGDDRERDEPLNSIDPPEAVLGLHYEEHRWGVASYLTMVDGKEARDADQSAEELFLPGGYGTLDILGYYAFNDQVRLNWGVFNIFDRKYWSWADVRGLPADDPDLERFTAPGRNASLTLTVDW